MNAFLKNVCVALLAGLVVSGCQTADPGADARAELEVECQLPRPEICTHEYRPVCGLVQTGYDWQWRTQGNGCSACGNPEVVGYKAGACDEPSSLAPRL